MLMDKRNEFADASTLVGVAATDNVLGNVIDLGSTSRDIGRGEDVRLRIQIATAVESTGTSNVTFKLVSDSTSNLATSPTTHWASAAIGKATLVAGYVVADLVLPAGTYERYLGVTYTPDTTDTNAGAADAFLLFDTAGQTYYADAI